MNTTRILSFALLTLAAVASSSLHAGIIFSDNFTQSNGTLLSDHTPTVGTGWSVPLGTPQIYDDAVNTYYSGSLNQTAAFGTFTGVLGAGDVLHLDFSTLDPFPGAFSGGYAGVSLYSGGAGGTEQFYFGILLNTESWSIAGDAIINLQNSGLFSPNVTGSAQSVHFTYAYDTGDWTYQVGTGSLSGTAKAHVALDSVRIGAGPDFNQWGSINVNAIQVSIIARSPGVPVPTASPLALAGLCLFLTFGAFAALRRS